MVYSYMPMVSINGSRAMVSINGSRAMVSINGSRAMVSTPRVLCNVG